MAKRPRLTLLDVVGLAAAVLVLKVTAEVVWGYRLYIPPRFDSDFLRGRESYFDGWYRWAFYTHIAAGPLCLVLGLLLISERVRGSRPRLHRVLGRIQVGLVLGLLTPSGLAMAFRPLAGPVAGIGLAGLALTTAASTALGLRAALRRRFAEHRRWMCRCFALLCSAVVLRILGGAATVLGVSALWFDPLAIWVSWLGPLIAFELREAISGRGLMFGAKVR